MIDELIDEALVFAGRERGWRPAQGKIRLGADLLEQSDAADWALALYARIVETATFVDPDATLDPSSSNEARAQDRRSLERAARQVIAAFARLVTVSNDGSVIEFQEFWRGPLRRFQRAADKPGCIDSEHRFNLDLAYVPERYNTQQHIAAWEAYEAHLEERLVWAVELLGLLRRGEPAENFDFVGRGIHWGGRGVPFSRSIDALLDVTEPSLDSWDRIDRCLNGCGAALVEFDGEIAYFMPE